MYCFILDDQYGKIIYEGLKHHEGLEFPLYENTKTPLQYRDSIIQHPDSLLILDNFFPQPGGREEPLGDQLLEELDHQGVYPNVICISDYGMELVTRYDNRKKWYENGYIIGFIPSKEPHHIASYLQTYDIRTKNGSQ